EQHQAYERLLLQVLAASRLERLVHARALSDRWLTQPEIVRSTLRAWLSCWRDVLLVQLGLADSSGREAAASVASRLGAVATREAAASVQQALADLDTNVNPRLVLDLLVLAFPRATLA
ncbi:MAG: hypothetical protein M3336_07545, partial [Chloroflexota bacterium]|nr:hypothetical protein [Chloroflexota bacterium]